MLVELFREHRSSRLAAARTYVQTNLPTDVSTGLSALPSEDKRELVRDLIWFYDNLGALVAHDVVDIWPVSGYLGGSVVDCWNALEHLIEGERKQRSSSTDKQRWQMYFQNMAVLISTTFTPKEARNRQRHWRLAEAAAD